MKKTIVVAASLILGVVSANSQSEKKEPPPPPPKPEVKYKPAKDEKIKNTSPIIIIDEKVNVSKPQEPPVITVKGKGADDFYKRNPAVSGISRQGSIITIKKNGTIEKYDMNKKEEDKSFTEKYGVSPIPPPPPPPTIKKES